MSGQRRKIQQLQLAFATRHRGEAPAAVAGGSEPHVTKRDTESQASDQQLMEAVCEVENVRQALKRVKSNKGGPGIDGMTVKQLPGYLAKHWPAVRAQLLEGAYKPQPVKRVEIPKPGGGVRKLGIPTVLDRFIQQAMSQVLQSSWDKTFSEHSFGFRPGRSAHQAIAQAQEYVAEGYRWVVDMDLEKFFDRVNHDKLMARIAKRVADKRVLKVIRAVLNSGVMEDGLVSPTEEGTPQGGPLSPLLSNLVLDELDRELEKRGHRFVRYADDCNIFVRSERAGHRVMASISRFVEHKLKLRVNRDKSAVGRPWERKFLGFTLTSDAKPRRLIAPQSLARFRDRVRQLTGRSAGRSIKRVVKDLAGYLNGWLGYFGFCEIQGVLGELDGWIRRRLRSLLWKQWKGGKRRYEALRELGVPAYLAARAAGMAASPWRASRSVAMSKALPTAYFTSLGLPTLAAETTP